MTKTMCKLAMKMQMSMFLKIHWMEIIIKDLKKLYQFLQLSKTQVMQAMESIKLIVHYPM